MLQAVQKFYAKSESVRAYTMLSPALILIIFIPTVGDYVTPALLGGTDGRMLSNMIQAYFGKINNIPLGAASATIMLFTVAVVTMVVSYTTKKLTQRIS